MAAPTLADRVKETSTTTGTGDFTLDGAESGFQSFNAAIGTSIDFLYAIVHQSAAEWETGVGSLSASTTLVRTTVIESSNADAAVSFSAGTKDVFIAPVGTRAALLASGGRLEPEHATGMVLLATATASADATVDFTSGIDGTYDEYVFALQNVTPATDGVILWLRTSTDGGSSWDAGASDYQSVTWSFQHNFSGSSGSPTDDKIVLAGNTFAVGSAAGENGVSGRVHVAQPSVAHEVEVWGQGVYMADDGELAGVISRGRRNAAADVNGLRFLFSSGNIESGKFKLYGVAK